MDSLPSCTAALSFSPAKPCIASGKDDAGRLISARNSGGAEPFWNTASIAPAIAKALVPEPAGINGVMALGSSTSVTELES